MISARAVTGTFRTLRWWADALLIAILFVVPWIRIAGEPLVLLDIPARKFHVFGLVIFPQELYFLWLMLAALALMLFLATALLGRLWCGWACPQTVFTDVFAGVARWIQGWTGPRPPARIPGWRRLLTHVAWAGLSLIIGFHLVGYFISPYSLLPALLGGTASAVSIGFLLFFAVLSYLDFVVVKQTFCKFLCPYARFQSVLFDTDTLVVGYDGKRGEPRGKKGTTSGDCVDCGLCVQVCPTEIDIRQGMQMECIACTQCIDVCNGVMQRLDRPANLIGYRSLVGLEGTRKVRLVRPRVLVYGSLLAASLVGFVVALAARVPVDFTVAHNRESLYTTAADGRLGNSFTLHLENRSREPRTFEIKLADGGVAFDLVAGINPITVAATSEARAMVFVMGPTGWSPPEGHWELGFVLEPVDEPRSRVVRQTHFLAPGGSYAR